MLTFSNVKLFKNQILKLKAPGKAVVCDFIFNSFSTEFESTASLGALWAQCAQSAPRKAVDISHVQVLQIMYNKLAEVTTVLLILLHM